MPSRNSVNKPKLTAPKRIRPTGRKPKLLTATDATGHALSTKSAGSLTTKGISKKRTKKNERNAKYRKEYLKALAGDAVMKDDDDVSKTLKKREVRLRKLALILENDLPAEGMDFESSGSGTTLGGPVV